MLVELSYSFRCLKKALAVEMDKLDLLPVLDLFANAPLQDIFVLFEFFFKFLGELNHAELVSSHATVLALAHQDVFPLLLLRLVLLLERLVLLEGFVAQARSHLEHEVTKVAVAQWVLHSHLQEQSWFSKPIAQYLLSKVEQTTHSPLRLEEAIF